MAIENAVFINTLNTSNPASSDSLKEADDHLRLIKQVLKTTFPNVTGAVTATHAQLNQTLPVGGIIMWSGAADAIPTGWGLCSGATYNKSDGSGTITSPDLRDRFVIGAGLNYPVGNSGGLAFVNLSLDQIPTHNHTIAAVGTISAAGGHSHTITDPGHTHGYISPRLTSATTNSFRTDNGTNLTATYQTDSASTGITVNAAADHTHAISITANSTSVGLGLAHENRPPFYALCFIIRL